MKKITEKMLLDGYEGKTNGGDNISIVSDQKIWWTYRTGRTDDGYNSVCSYDNAGEITLEVDRIGTIQLDTDNMDHPTLSRIEADEAVLWGDAVTT